MFEKNDKSLLAVRILLNVAFAIAIISCVAFGITMCFLEDDLIFLWILIAIFGIFLFWIGWVVGRAMLAFFCDVKLIRNKLYNYDNDNLHVFFCANGNGDNQNISTEQTKVSTRTDAATVAILGEDINYANCNGATVEQLLRELKEVYDSGALTFDEYTAEKQKILNR